MKFIGTRSLFLLIALTSSHFPTPADARGIIQARASTCVSIGSTCGTARDCCDKTALCRNTLCTPCSLSGSTCTKTNDCCNQSEICRSAGVCGACSATNGVCGKAKDCCDQTQVCQNSKCTACAATGGTCDTNKGCCSQSDVCLKSVCTTCVAMGGTCSRTKVCCDKNASCINNVCTLDCGTLEACNGVCCPADQTCDGSGKCSVPNPCTAGLGEPCVLGSCCDPTKNLVCFIDGPISRCQSQAGGRCQTNFDCTFGNCCDTTQAQPICTPNPFPEGGCF